MWFFAVALSFFYKILGNVRNLVMPDKELQEKE
jgi:hypothetical protein